MSAALLLLAISLGGCDDGIAANQRAAKTPPVDTCGGCDQTTAACLAAIAPTSAVEDTFAHLAACQADNVECILRECEHLPAACAACMGARTECLLLSISALGEGQDQAPLQCDELVADVCPESVCA